jgi:lipopolysaccharide export system protein LptA
MKTGTNMTPVKPTLLLLLSLFAMQALALPSDRDQPIQIEADKLEIDDSKNISVYEGNVRMQQGSLDIKADRIILHFDTDRNLERLDITGTPAIFKQLNARKQPISGSAQQMEYYEQQSLLEMKGEARFKSENDTLESEAISINTETEAIQAGDPQGKSRVRMLIQPKQ